MLGDVDAISFSQTTQTEKAKAFYGGVLGLNFLEDSPFALLFRSGRTTVRIQKVESFTPFPFTSLGWNVPDIEATAKQLLEKGIKCERFNGMKQDDLGIWLSPGNSKVCWFKDPDGNLLSLSEAPKA